MENRAAEETGEEAKEATEEETGEDEEVKLMAAAEETDEGRGRVTFLESAGGRGEGAVENLPADEATEDGRRGRVTMVKGLETGSEEGRKMTF